MKLMVVPIIKVGLGISALCAGAWLILPCGCRPRESARRASCQSNLKEIGLGIAQYIQDYDGLLPLITQKGANYGWADVLIRYYKSPSTYQCPSETHPPGLNPRLPGYTDYWMNSNVGGKTEKSFQQPITVIAFGDGNTGADSTDGRYHLSSFPVQWAKDESVPAFRHLGGANYAFLDGHVKWFRPDHIKHFLTIDKIDAGKPGRQ